MQDVNNELANYQRDLDAKLLSLRRVHASQSIRVDAGNTYHVDLLKQLWIYLILEDTNNDIVASDFDKHHAAFDLESPLWASNGFQTKSPISDFRGGGQLALQNLVYFVQNFGPQAHTFKKHNQYPFSLAAVNVTRMILDLLMPTVNNVFEPTTIAPTPYWKLADDPDAFHKLYCMAFMMLDLNWTETKATAMDFNRVLTDCKTSMSKFLRTNPDSVETMWKLWLDARVALKEEWANKAGVTSVNTKEIISPNDNKRSRTSSLTGTNRQLSTSVTSSEALPPVMHSLSSSMELPDNTASEGDKVEAVLDGQKQNASQIVKQVDLDFLSSKVPLHLRNNTEWKLVFNVKEHGYNIETFYEVMYMHMGVVIH